MEDRLRVALLFGGASEEHEVSLQSAAAVLGALDRQRFDVIPVGIDRQGRWLVPDDLGRALRSGPDLHQGRPVTFDPAAGLVVAGASLAPDVAFPVLHGPRGEDGTVQGLLELLGLPYVGSGVLSSALCMDKAAMKRVFEREGLPVTPSVLVRRGDWQRRPDDEVGRIESLLRYPLFTKPANLGSSVGVSRCPDRDALHRGMDLAARFDRRLIVEQGVDARDVECGVLGNDEPSVSVPAQVQVARDFYDYEAKYRDPGTSVTIPAPLPARTVAEVQRLSAAAFRALDCAGLARVDFLVERGTERVLLNEVNTLPGFTPVSAFPKMWAASGLPYPSLVARLVELALDRHGQREDRPSGG